jgi:hypothetical protein
MSTEIGKDRRPPDPDMMPPFETHVERVIQLMIDGEWVTKRHLGGGTVIACSAYAPDSFETTHCVPLIPSKPKARTVALAGGQEHLTVYDWHPELVDLSEYPVNLPDFPSITAIRQALLWKRQAGADSGGAAPVRLEQIPVAPHPSGWSRFRWRRTRGLNFLQNILPLVQ